MSYKFKKGILYARHGDDLVDVNVLTGDSAEILASIEEKGRETLESIPENYTEMANEIDSKATIYKLYFDGAEIFKSFEDFEEYIPMTFDEVYELCYEPTNYVYIGDGQMKYYPQLDLNISSKPESITFISTAQLDGKNFHTRIIINANNEVKTNQIIDAPMSEISAIKADLSDKLDKPTDAPVVGKVLKVKSVNEDGSFVCEWADEVIGVTDKEKEWELYADVTTTEQGYTTISFPDAEAVFIEITLPVNASCSSGTIIVNNTPTWQSGKNVAEINASGVTAVTYKQKATYSVYKENGFWNSFSTALTGGAYSLRNFPAYGNYFTKKTSELPCARSVLINIPDFPIGTQIKIWLIGA